MFSVNEPFFNGHSEHPIMPACLSLRLWPKRMLCWVFQDDETFAAGDSGTLYYFVGTDKAAVFASLSSPAINCKLEAPVSEQSSWHLRSLPVVLCRWKEACSGENHCAEQQDHEVEFIRSAIVEPRPPPAWAEGRRSWPLDPDRSRRENRVPVVIIASACWLFADPRDLWAATTISFSFPL